MDSNYIPDRGDVVWIDFSPQVGHEQSGSRPAFHIYDPSGKVAFYSKTPCFIKLKN